MIVPIGCGPRGALAILRCDGTTGIKAGERKPTVANLNVTYADMQSAAKQLQGGEQQIQGDLSKLKKLIDNLVAGGYVTDSSSRQFEASYTEFNTGATKMIQGLNGMGQYLDAAAKAFNETDTQLASALKK
jgi:WXG100 family type VII secretion target